MGVLLHFPGVKTPASVNNPEDQMLSAVEQFDAEHFGPFMEAVHALDSAEIETPEQLYAAMQRVKELVAQWPE